MHGMRRSPGIRLSRAEMSLEENERSPRAAGIDWLHEGATAFPYVDDMESIGSARYAACELRALLACELCA